MLIVSQDNKTVVNLNLIESIMVSRNNQIDVAGIWNESENYSLYHIASYESEAKAKSVLVQLWSAYSNGEKVFIMP